MHTLLPINNTNNMKITISLKVKCLRVWKSFVVYVKAIFRHHLFFLVHSLEEKGKRKPSIKESKMSTRKHFIFSAYIIFSL